jgi:hypothetical protein
MSKSEKAPFKLEKEEMNKANSEGTKNMSHLKKKTIKENKLMSFEEFTKTSEKIQAK